MVEDATTSPESTQLQLDGYEGPLELLIELARGQRVELARISIVSLVDQFVAAVAECSAGISRAPRSGS